VEYKEILDVIAPCGLNCQKCFAYSKGEIKKLSTSLQKKLGTFDRYAERFSEFLPVFNNYPAFKKLLSYFTQSDCPGCRRGTGRYPDCAVNTCYREKDVDFCFQCEQFPCQKVNFDSDLKRRWIKINNRMKDIGVKSYYEETKDLSRYR
jgi:hypothetical protein